MKKYLPFFLSILSLSIAIFFWDLIKLPYDEENKIVGEYFYKKHNPSNDTIRFLLSIGLPLIIYFITYLKINRDIFSANPFNQDYFLRKKKVILETRYLKNYFNFFLILILLEFLSIDFKSFISNVNSFHTAAFLVPPQNYLESGELFKSTLYNYGLLANNMGLIFHQIFGFYSMGSIAFIILLLILIMKFILLLFAKEISKSISSNINTNKLFFIIFSFIVISLPDYYDHQSYFAPKFGLLLIFVYILSSALSYNQISRTKIYIIGSFSLLSIISWFDVGIYTNFIILLTIIYLFFLKEYQNILFLLLGVLSSWLIFFLLLPAGESREFFHNLSHILSVSDYLNGIEYLKPFSQDSTRWTKALFIIYFTGVMLVSLNFSKKLNINTTIKIFTSLTFICGIVVFKSALSRSDAAHIKYSSGFYTIVFICAILILLFYLLENNQKIRKIFLNLKKFNYSKSIYIFFIICSISFITNFRMNLDSRYFGFKNLINVKNNIVNLVTAEDNLFLNKEDLQIVEFYKKISMDDNCAMVLTEDNSLPYLLKKRTCTQFIAPLDILVGLTEKKFLSQLEQSSPNYILYDVDTRTNILLNFDNMPNVIKYINENYSFFQNYNGYIFYKKNN
ncbi:hypothetical protein PQY72_00915 [Pelagibacteraceae bacterium]|nr:hypothetical protein [Pelagibacteraceae bacterium]